MRASHAPVEDEAADGVEVSLLRGVVEGQEGLLVERVGVAAGAQQQLSQLQVAAARRHVQDGVAVLDGERGKTLSQLEWDKSNLCCTEIGLYTGPRFRE